MNSIVKTCLTSTCFGLLISCGGGGSGGGSAPVASTPTPSPIPTPSPTPTPVVTATPTPTPTPTPVAGTETSELTKLNQIGYYVTGEKIAIIPSVSATEFTVKSASDNAIVYTGTLTSEMQWNSSGSDRFKQADFSDFTTEGSYYLEIDGVADSHVFSIGNDIYADLHDASLKAYYYNRASIALDAQYAGQWARPAGHPDTNVLVHSSAASSSRATGTSISSPKGWYDAGDFGKYVVNSGISTYTLLASYQHFSSFYDTLNVNIPESGNSVPDILDEIKWNLDWMATMQDTDGGVYHKLSALNWPGQEMPASDTRQRYVIGKATAATLNFAAVMALASKIYADFETEYPGQSAAWLAQAEDAWDWAQQNSNIRYSGGSDGDNGSGQYGDGSFTDEMSWAAVELFLATEKNEYLTAFLNLNTSPSTPGWQNVSGLPFMSLVANGEDLLTSAVYTDVKDKLIAYADSVVQQYETSPYKTPMTPGDFVWGSNGVAANKGMMLMQAYRETNDSKYRDAALGTLSYLLGRNPTDFSYVTAFGHKTPMGIHHRQSDADNIALPVPGFLAGGPHTGRQDGCDYPSNDRAKNYLDDWCSYSTNEVTINWNAPLLYLTAALINTTP